MATSKRPRQQELPYDDLEERLVELLRRREVEWERRRSKVVSDGKYPCPFTGKPRAASSLPDAFPSGASERTLNSFSRRTGVELPVSLRKWLKITNGAGGFFGIRPRRKDDDIERAWDYWEDMKDRGWIPVARDDFGNLYVQLFPGGMAAVEPVCYVEVIGRYIAYVAASDMLHFALFQLEDAYGIHQEVAKAKGLEAFYPKAKLRRGAPKMALHPWPLRRRRLPDRIKWLKFLVLCPV
jgi:hypothetical protein